MGYLVEDHANDIGAQAGEYGDDLGDVFAAGRSGAADDEDSIGGAGHLEAFGKAQQRRGIENDQIVFLAELVEQG